MGKALPLPTAIKLQGFVRNTSRHSNVPQVSNPRLKTRSPHRSLETKQPTPSSGAHSIPLSKMDGSESEARKPLSAVVSDCVHRWFHDTLREARAGDTAMQVLVGQMYYSGYGVPRDEKKARAWIARASRSRSSAWKVSDKRPGYNASDSDSDELKGDEN